ncbi:RIO1 family regulatory kinase/ATPase [Rodentibacter pneumotropicus]|uniref:RIO1 family regulatory kinase/ATPase domain-containing protein n=1 Tax=Rodentibacter pneumotropicus TaxID=758 RepID=UPI001863B322|nr:RIO1 family regulatory kinase/ATPase [Rodentibacter pneumotropicus]
MIWSNIVTKSCVNAEFQAHVKRILEEQKGKRVYKFSYQGKEYLLKQPERLSGVWLLLKPYPKKSFKNELMTLLYLSKQGVPVPKVVYHGKDFFVLEDVGMSISQWTDDPSCSEEQKFSILSDASQALIGLHKKGLVHGRPAIRDIIWNNSKVIFLDFESRSKSQNKDWLIVRDMLFFFDSLCHKNTISDELIKEIALYYQTHCDSRNWEIMQNYLSKFRWVYYLLLPFKPVAKKDLISIYRLFNLLYSKEK